MIAPLFCGVTAIQDFGEYDAGRWLRLLSSQKVTVWYTAPTAIRRLMRAGDDLKEKYDLSALRRIYCVGEILGADAVNWAEKSLGVDIYDTWWQTETGSIMIATVPGMPLKPGWAGKTLPGVEAAILRRSGDGAYQSIEIPGETGYLALKRGRPSMFRGYWEDEDRYRACFSGDWYITGDLAQQDKDGYFRLLGRADEIIKTSGQMVGPGEIEQALMQHPAVAQAGIIGIPDPLLGERIKAFVILKPGFAEDETLRRELLGFGRKRLGPAIAPQEIEFTSELPVNRAGKIMRRLLKARELGLPEGDISTLERSDS
jgi:acetyl-CoA synthetase